MLLLAQTKQKLGTLTFHVFLYPSVTVRPSRALLKQNGCMQRGFIKNFKNTLLL